MRFTIQLLLTIISKVWNRTSILPFEIICLPTHSRKNTVSKFAWVHSELQNTYLLKPENFKATPWSYLNDDEKTLEPTRMKIGM